MRYWHSKSDDHENNNHQRNKIEEERKKILLRMPINHCKMNDQHKQMKIMMS